MADFNKTVPLVSDYWVSNGQEYTATFGFLTVLILIIIIINLPSGYLTTTIPYNT